MSVDGDWFAVVNGPRPKWTPEELLHARKLSKTYAAWNKCFFGPDGEVTSAGRTVLADLLDVCGFGIMPSLPTDQELREWHSKRIIILHAVNRLDRHGTKADQLTRAIREHGHE